MPDFIMDAVRRYLREGSRGIDWVWFHCMSADDRVRFDRWLVATDDELAHQAGLPTSRFHSKVCRVANQHSESKERSS